MPEAEAQQVRRARLGLLFIFAVNGFVLASWAARIPAVKDAAHLSVAQLGVVLLAPALGALVAFELSGRASAHYGSAPVTRACAVAFCGVLPLIAATDAAVWSLLVTLFVFGAGNGALDVAMNTHGVKVEEALGRPALSGMHAAFSGGGLIGAAAGAGAAAAHLGLTVHFTAVALFAVVCALTAGHWLDLHQTVVTSTELRPDETGTTAGVRRPPNGLRGILPGPVLLLGAVGFACLLGEGAAADWSATYMRDGVHTSDSLAAAAYAGFSAAMVGGRLSGDWLRARVPVARLLPLCAGAACMGLLGGLLIGGAAAGIVGFTLFGAGLAVIIPIVFSAAGNLAASRTGMPAPRALARVSTLSYLGFLAGPPLVGAVAAVTGLRASLLIPAALAAMVAVMGRRAVSLSVNAVVVKAA